jgi:hypothetical protein
MCTNSYTVRKMQNFCYAKAGGTYIYHWHLKFPNVTHSGDTGPCIRLAIYGIKLCSHVLNPNTVHDAQGSHYHLHLVIHLYIITTEQEYQLTSSDGFAVEKPILQFANTWVSNTNGLTVLNRIGMILRCFLYMLRTPTCLLTDVATVLPGNNKVIHSSICWATSASYSRGPVFKS